MLLFLIGFVALIVFLAVFYFGSNSNPSSGEDYSYNHQQNRYNDFNHSDFNQSGLNNGMADIDVSQIDNMGTNLTAFEKEQAKQFLKNNPGMTPIDVMYHPELWGGPSSTGDNFNDPASLMEGGVSSFDMGLNNNEENFFN
ncbi:hypothetical protein [Treponema sp.]|uniref:hypothetical protein n=1 Tax=Treponema sp. TaxID=166 RepID=UPI0025E88117|nr:hypothetical protein [Treponema sp.]MCR5218985.1 hypothetical protein [Treponema sp.]